MKRRGLAGAICSILIISLLIGAVCLLVSAEGYTGRVKNAEQYLQSAAAVDDLAVKEEKLALVAKYLSAYPVDPKSYGYDEFVKSYAAEVVKCAVPYMESAAAVKDQGHITFTKAVSALDAFLTLHTVAYGHESFATVEGGQSVAEFYEDYLESCEKVRADLELDTPIEEYSYNVWYDLSFDKDEQDYEAPTLSSDNDKNVLGKEYDGDNGYYTIRYGSTNHSFFFYKISAPANGFVCEFDITTYGELPENGIWFENGSLTVGGSTYYPKYLKIDKDGNMLDFTGATVFEGAVTPGVWTHIAIAFDPSEFIYRFYVNDVYVGRSNAKTGTGTNYAEYNVEHSPSRMRIGAASGVDTGEFSVDNFKLYSGSRPRTPGRYDDATNDILFMKSVHAFTNESNFAPYRMEAYQQATTYVYEFWDTVNKTYKTEDEDVRDAVDAYLAFDLEAFKSGYAIQIRAEYVDMIDELASTARTLDTVKTRKDLVTAIDVYAEKYDAYMTSLPGDSDFAVFNEAKNTYTTLVSALSADTAASELVGFMKDFALARTSFKMEDRLALAMERYPLVDMSVRKSAGFEELDEYLVYLDEDCKKANEMIYDLQSVENAESIVGYCRLISAYPDEESWEANADIVARYVERVREIAESGHYDKSYPGVVSSLAGFGEINEYFLNKLRAEHKTFISAQLERYRSSGEYVVKLGAATAIIAYDEEMGVYAHADEELRGMLDTAYIYLEELKVQKEDYNAVLKQNASYFVNIVNSMTLTADHAELTALRAEAYLYYYAIDATVAGCAEAVEIYELVCAGLDRSNLAVTAYGDALAMALGASKDEDVFAALVQCILISEDVVYISEEYGEMLVQYGEVYDGYLSGRLQVNSEIKDTTDLVLSLRGEYVNGEIIGILDQILN